jgi:hypothetical protein
MPDLTPLSPQFVATTVRAQDVAADVLVVPVFHGEQQLADLSDLDRVVGGEWSRASALA